MFVAKEIKDFCSIVVDFNGFGQTPEPTRPYTVQDYADEVLSVLAKNSVKRVSIIGHSFGGRVAIEIASKYPDIVRSLVLIDSAGIKPKRKPSYFIKVWLHKLLVKLGFSGLKGSKDYHLLSPIMKQTFKNVVSYDQTPLLKDIKCPTAIFWGRKDKETPLYMAKKLKNEIKNSELFLLDGGHFSYVDDIGTFFSILHAFLQNTKDDKIIFGGKI